MKQFFCTGSIIAQSQNTSENTPHKGQVPCERPTPIVTNPFAPQNTEWFSQRNRFNWMEDVTYHHGGNLYFPYFTMPLTF
jgi:hypothetical protein